MLPEDAVLSDAGAQRPGGLPTSIKLDPEGPKGHYSFNFPIQPDNGDKETLFQISYSLPYSSGKYRLQVHSDSAGRQSGRAHAQGHELHLRAAGASFKSVQEDPGIQTYLLKNAIPGNPSNSRSLEQDPCRAKTQGAAGGQQSENGGSDGGHAR